MYRGSSAVPKIWVRFDIYIKVCGRRAFRPAVKIDPRGRLERPEEKMLA